jgi:hypothetical protein
MTEKTKSIFIRHIPATHWIEYQVKCKREGISAAESIRRHIKETVETKKK